VRWAEAACDRLLDDPMLGWPRHELMPGMRSMPVRPHVVFYQMSKRTIEVVRVLHQRMDVEHVFPSRAEVAFSRDGFGGEAVYPWLY
jgi:plasmid stabilization system protein ParE